MIASVVATLAEVGDAFQEIVDELAAVSGVEIGAVGNDARRVPITIDSPAPNALEEVTRRLQECRGVTFVDVVFVHFEDEPESEPAANSGEMDKS
jgi:nitrate reductase NapAB chaperone NapD